jgi:hypothetical protein
MMSLAVPVFDPSLEAGLARRFKLRLMNIVQVNVVQDATN